LYKILSYYNCFNINRLKINDLFTIYTIFQGAYILIVGGQYDPLTYRHSVLIFANHS